MSETTIFHPSRGFGLCYVTRYEEAPAGLTHPEHGRIVFCGTCSRYGVIPEPGHELDFMPPGTTRTPDGQFILGFP